MAHPTFTSTGPDAAYQPKTTDEGDGTTAGGLVSHVNSQRVPMTMAVVFSAPVGAGWTRVATTTGATRGLRIGPIAAASAYDLEWTVAQAGSPVPGDVYGEAVLGGDDFAGGVPIGDIYVRSATTQIAIVKMGS